MSVYEEALRRAAEQKALAQAANIPDPLMFGLDYADLIEQQIAPVVQRQTWRPETDFDQETNYQSIFPAGGFKPEAPAFTGPINQQPGIADLRRAEDGPAPRVFEPSISAPAPIEALTAAGMIPNTAVEAPVIGGMNGPAVERPIAMELYAPSEANIQKTPDALALAQASGSHWAVAALENQLALEQERAANGGSRVSMVQPNTAVQVGADATPQERMLAQQGIDLANMTIRRSGTPDIVDGVATFPAYEVPLSRETASPEQVTMLQAIGVLPYDDPAAEIARQQTNAKTQADTMRAMADLQSAQAEAQAAARPKMMEVGGAVISVDPTTGAVTPIYNAPAKPEIRLVPQPDGTQLAVDMSAVTPGQAIGTPSAPKRSDIVSDDDGVQESEEVRRQVQRYYGDTAPDWGTIRAARNAMLDADNMFDPVRVDKESAMREYMAGILAESVEDPDNLREAALESTEVRDEKKRSLIQRELRKIAKRLDLDIEDDLLVPGTQKAADNKATPASATPGKGNRFVDPDVEAELQ